MGSVEDMQHSRYIVHKNTTTKNSLSKFNSALSPFSHLQRIVTARLLEVAVIVIMRDVIQNLILSSSHFSTLTNTVAVATCVQHVSASLLPNVHICIAMRGILSAIRSRIVAC